jgi:hypothetical protein
MPVLYHIVGPQKEEVAASHNCCLCFFEPGRSLATCFLRQVRSSNGNCKLPRQRACDNRAPACLYSHNSPFGWEEKMVDANI